MKLYDPNKSNNLNNNENFEISKIKSIFDVNNSDYIQNPDNYLLTNSNMPFYYLDTPFSN